MVFRKTLIALIPIFGFGQVMSLSVHAQPSNVNMPTPYPRAVDLSQVEDRIASLAAEIEAGGTPLPWAPESYTTLFEKYSEYGTIRLGAFSIIEQCTTDLIEEFKKLQQENSHLGPQDPIPKNMEDILIAADNLNNAAERLPPPYPPDPMILIEHLLVIDYLLGDRPPPDEMMENFRNHKDAIFESYATGPGEIISQMSALSCHDPMLPKVSDEMPARLDGFAETVESVLGPLPS